MNGNVTGWGDECRADAGAGAAQPPRSRVLALSTSGVTRTPRFDHFSPELYSFDSTRVLQNPHTRQYDFARASVSCVEDGLKLGS